MLYYAGKRGVERARKTGEPGGQTDETDGQGTFQTTAGISSGASQRLDRRDSRAALSILF